MATPVKQPAKKTATPEARRQTVVQFLLDRDNYYIIGAGILLLVIGYCLMAGGEQPQNQYNESEIYSWRRVTLSPVIVIIGYIVIAYGIMRKPRVLQAD